MHWYMSTNPGGFKSAQKEFAPLAIRGFQSYVQVDALDASHVLNKVERALAACDKADAAPYIALQFCDGRGGVPSGAEKWFAEDRALASRVVEALAAFADRRPDLAPVLLRLGVEVDRPTHPHQPKLYRQALALFLEEAKKADPDGKKVRVVCSAMRGRASYRIVFSHWKLPGVCRYGIDDYLCEEHSPCVMGMSFFNPNQSRQNRVARLATERGADWMISESVNKSDAPSVEGAKKWFDELFDAIQGDNPPAAVFFIPKTMGLAEDTPSAREELVRYFVSRAS